jgi:glutamate-1-semialdehyde 2,1-aminomutase
MPNVVGPNQHDPVITVSDEWYERAVAVQAPVTQVLAKGPTQFVGGVAPKYLVRGDGARVWDPDGNEYLDYHMAVGPVSLGYRHPAVDAAMRAQIDDGINFSLMHPLEVEVSELVVDMVPAAELVRFGKSGAEATSAAIRLARAYTGRERVLSCGYHGWHDWYAGTLIPKAGVPQAVQDLIATFAYNDLASLEAAIDDDVAAVIMEPMTFVWPEPGFLEGVRDLAHRHGAVFILDEIWTGFRWARGGAQEYFGITPDLATVSKGMGNGVPISALVGAEDLMRVLDGPVFFYSTFGGEALSLAATKATLEVMRDEPVHEHLERLGVALRDGYNAIAAELGLGDVTSCSGHGARTLVTYSDTRTDPLVQKSIVQQELLRAGILWTGFHTMCYAHTDADVDYTLEAYRGALASLARALESGDPGAHLRGAPIEPVFRPSTGFHTKPRVRG